MRLERWALIAEISSAVVVAVSLIILIIGVRDNTEVLRASAYADLMQSLNAIQTEMARDSELGSAYLGFIRDDTEGLSESQSNKLNYSLLNLFRTYESAYVSNRSGLMGRKNHLRVTA